MNTSICSLVLVCSGYDCCDGLTHCINLLGKIFHSSQRNQYGIKQNLLASSFVAMLGYLPTTINVMTCTESVGSSYDEGYDDSSDEGYIQ